jgi:prolyl-tRNA editing enzyme YbaK/EbsC (Cys-tRNA(Pro) deacylase)
MAIERVKNYFSRHGMEEEVIEFEVSSATVELAALALGCEPKQIAKTLSFYDHTGAILVVTAGDAKIDNQKFKEHFNLKAKMLRAEEVEPLIGHGIGGVCPFGVNDGVRIFLDVSLKRFEKVYPAAGSANSAIAMSIPSLEIHSKALGWIDVCKEWSL